MADVYGRRRVFLTGLAIFTLSSLTAGLAGSGGVLIGARAVQGLGAALLMPATLAIIGRAFTDARERTAAIGIWGAIGALGLALGPVVGGLISQHIHWGWIFLINVPARRGHLRDRHPVRSPSRAADGSDVAAAAATSPGLTSPASSAVALFSLTYALIEGHDRAGRRR